MRYLICFPQGGINDMWSRIQMCISYCLHQNRMLVLDTTKNWFRHDWRTYFAIPHDIVYQGHTSDFITHLLTKDVYPPELRNRTYESLPDAVWIRHGRMEMDGIMVSTSLLVPYAQEVVVYADCGSSLHINSMLSMLTFSDELKLEYQRRRSLLPPQYLAVHIRNTDHKSDLDTFLAKHDSLFRKHDIFVATDHHDSLIRMKTLYGAHIHSFANLPQLPYGVNIHESKQSQALRTTRDQHHAFLIDMFLDFLLLASGSQYIASTEKSGFSRSVHELRRLPSLIHHLVS